MCFVSQGGVFESDVEQRPIHVEALAVVLHDWRLGRTGLAAFRWHLIRY